MSETKATTRYRPETRLVHSGALRSQFGETSEAIFLTQGFIYDSAEQCEARFKGEDPGFLYSRFSNPNISMFERRMIALEGAEAARATATSGKRRCARPPKPVFWRARPTRRSTCSTSRRLPRSPIRAALG